jgi:hypothetical protein
VNASHGPYLNLCSRAIDPERHTIVLSTLDRLCIQQKEKIDVKIKFDRQNEYLKKKNMLRLDCKEIMYVLNQKGVPDLHRTVYGFT